MSAIFLSRYERRWERLRCTRCVNCCTRAGACIVISICVNEGYSLYNFVWLDHIVLSSFVCISLEMISCFWYQPVWYVVLKSIFLKYDFFG